jgi:RNA polymerase-binding transcription factor DksA
MKRCSKCKELISEERLRALPNTKTCVKCSDEEKVGCVDIIYHKTGNTIQILPKEQADSINKAAQRRGFGSLSSMRGGSGKSNVKVEVEKESNSFNYYLPTEEDFLKVGEEMMFYVEIERKDKALQFIKSARESQKITGIHYRRLRDILDQFMPEEKKKAEVVRETKIDPDIEEAFKNWRNSKVYR